MKKNYPTNAVFYLTKTFNIFLFICLMLVASASFGQTTIPFNSSGTFTVPCDVTSITVKVWGGGGSGGGSTTKNKGGEGGGAGGYSTGTISVSAGQRIDYIVGDGGRGRNGNGRDGSSSTFSTVTADGGEGGISNGGTGANGGSGNAGTGGKGGVGGGNTGGRGGSAPSGGTGGAGGTNTDGSDGSAPGGGGGGGETSNNGNDSSGGDGGNGKIEITYTSSFNSYCIPSFTNIRPISNVTFSGISNNTSNSLSVVNDYESFCDVATVTQGSTTNAISLKGNTNGGYQYNFIVYIDWDQNGVFGNVSNEIYTIGTLTSGDGGSSSPALIGNISVPTNALLGSTRMRVISENVSYAPACQNGSFGQAEDYTVNVTSPCPTYVINNISATNTCISGTSTATISSTASGLPLGNYTVTYNRSSPSATELTATMTVSTAGTGSFSVTGLTTAGSSTITVTKLTLGSCATTFTGKSANLTVNANNTATVVFGSPNVCVGTAITAVTHTTTGATGIGGATGLPAGITSSFASNSITISGTPTASGIYNYSIPLTGGCGTINATGTIIVSATDTAPTVGTRTQPTCTTATGSVVLNGLPPEWALTQYPGGTTTTGTGISKTISGLSPGTYTYSVVDTRKGLKGEYFNSTASITNVSNPTFPTTSPTLTRTDATVDFDWVNGNPGAPIGNDNFFVRWSGQIQPLYSQNYTFTTRSDDGVRLWVNGVQIINDWNIYAVKDNTGTISLTAGVKYDIVLEYYENAGQAVSKLYWNSTSQAKEIIPQSQLFPNAICGSPASANVVINAQPVANTVARTSAAATTSQVVCINTAITPITYSTTGATGATVTNLPAGVTGSWSGNVVTISGTPIVAGAAKTYTVTLTGGCGTVTTTGTIAVTANNTVALTSAVGTDAQTTCINSAITNITYSTVGATGATVTNLPTGVTGSWSGNVVTISGTPTVAGVAKTYTVTLTGGCGTITTTGTIAVTANNTVVLTSAVGTAAQTTCINTAITNITYSTVGATGATVTNLPTGVTGSWSGNVVTISGTPTVAGVAKTYTVTLTGGCGTITTTGTIAVTANNTVALTSAVGTAAQTTCINSAITNITYSTVGATGATVTNLPTGVTGSWSGNVVTISGTPTVAGVAKTYTVTLTGGCGTITITGTIAVTANNTVALTSAAATTSQVVCINTAIMPITYSTTGATGATVTNLPAGVTGSWSGNVVTISGTPTVAGAALTYTVTLTGGCGTVTTTGTTGVNPLISNNSISSSQTICTSTAPSAFTGTIPTGGSGSYVYLWESSTTSAASDFVTASGTSNTKGYTAGALTATTWYRRTVTSGGCSNTSTAIQITVNNTPTISGITSTATLCSGGSLNPTVPTVTDNGSTVTASGWQLETGVGSGSFASISIPYTVGFADNGKKIRYYATNGCGTINSNEVAITVEDVLAAPTIGAITQPDCVTPTGSVVLSGLPATWTLVRSDGTSSTTTSGTGTTTTISELAAGSYTYTVFNGTCTSSATAVGDIVINPAITNTWDGTKWSDGTPTILQAIKFTDGYDIDADVDGCSCKVTGSKNVTIKAGKTMKIVNEVEVLGSGKLIFENNASLVQINDDAVNKGNIIYKRTTPEIKKTDYVYWSSPVSLAALKAIQTGTLYYSFNGSGNSWVNANANTIMNTGKGYIVRGAGTWFDTGNVTLTANFVGTPTNGVIPVTIVGAGKNNLIGNPYPSAVDGDAFLAANTDVLGGPTDVLEGTLYFWTHKSAIQLASGIDPGKAGSGAYAYTSDDYSAFTKVGGTNSVTGYIAAGQGFFARGSTTGGQAKFVNSMRLNGDKTLDNSGFLKPASASKTEKTTTTNKIEKSRIWLNLTNTQGAFKQMLLGYMTGATDNYDRGYDALSFNGNSFVNFYSINNTSLLTIQGRALPIQQTDVVPLGYSSTIAGDFSISIDKTDGALSTMAVFVEDKLTNTTHNLKKGAYTFTTEKGTFDDRFVLSYTNKTLATDDFQVVENQVVITSKNKEININASTNYIDKVFVYDVTGKQIFLKSKIDKNEFTISNLGSTNHVLVVKVLLQDNSIVTKKIIF